MTHSTKNTSQLTGKYVTSPIDGKRYCRKNGQFLRHIRNNGYSGYQEFFELYYPNDIKYCQCTNKCKFIPKTMSYLRTCGNKQCGNKLASKTKQSFSDTQWDIQRNKFRQTMSAKSPNELQRIDANRRNTNIDRYGVDHPWKSNTIRKQIQQTMTETFGAYNYSTTLVSDSSRQLLEDGNWMYNQHVTNKLPLYKIGRLLDVGDRTIGTYMKKHNIEIQHYQRSYWEIELEQMFNNQNIRFESNNRTILDTNKELDFFLPDHNIAVELCGLYWHSEKHERITKKYHYDKMMKCLDVGITLLTIFEDEWEHKDVIISKLLYMTGKTSGNVFARNTMVDLNVDYSERKRFLDTYHIQGNGNGSTAIGLRADNQLVAVGLFAKRTNTNSEYTLDRYATSTGVVGGFSRIMKHFERVTAPTKLITFADRRYSTGKLYDKCGFVLDGYLPPDYAYIVNGKRVHKSNFRHDKLKRKLKQYNKNKSERDNCFDHGMYRVWDCGKIRYVKNFSTK